MKNTEKGRRVRDKVVVKFKEEFRVEREDTLQQDNNLKHTASDTMEEVNSKHITVLEWSS